MKRNFFIMAAILLILAGSFSCKEKEDTKRVYSTKEGRIDINENEFIIMRLLPESAPINSSMKLIIENHTKEDLIYGSEFSIEYFNKNNWKEIRLDIMWTDIGIITFAGETSEEEINLYSLVKKHSKWKNGKYRIIKILYKQKLYAEFEIK